MGNIKDTYRLSQDQGCFYYLGRVMQKLLNCSQVLIEYFYCLTARVIGFLAMYHDWVLRATYHDWEALMGQNVPLLECYAVALLFLSFLDCYCIMSEHE